VEIPDYSDIAAGFLRFTVRLEEGAGLCTPAIRGGPMKE